MAMIIEKKKSQWQFVRQAMSIKILMRNHSFSGHSITWKMDNSNDK